MSIDKQRELEKKDMVITDLLHMKRKDITLNLEEVPTIDHIDLDMLCKFFRTARIMGKKNLEIVNCTESIKSKFMSTSLREFVKIT